MTNAPDGAARSGSGATRVERHPRDGWALADPVPLSAGSERALIGLVRALLPPPPAPHPDDIEARVALHMRRMLHYMPAATRHGFVWLLHLLDWAPVWRLRAPSRLSRLPQADASRVLASIAQSRWAGLRLLLLGPKAMVLSTYFDQDEVHAALGYQPRGFIEGRIARRAELLASGALGGSPAEARSRGPEGAS